MNLTEPEILAALAEAGLTAHAAVCISTLRSREIGRLAYRIDAGDRIVKARRLETAEAARRLVGMRRELPEAFSRVLSRHGRVLLEEWIDGDPLRHPPDPQWLDEAGALLGGLHARAAVGRRVLHHKHDTAAHRATAVSALGAVVAAGALTAHEATRLEAAMERLDPESAIHGLVHFDFTGENMVTDRLGRLRVVDNERIGIDALGFDLARAWYRWALPAPDWHRFASSYGATLPFSEPLETMRFWRIVAVARAAALRLRACPELAETPLACLRALASEHSP